eukprot:745936-Hanusia_phi.AAC.1
MGQKCEDQEKVVEVEVLAEERMIVSRSCERRSRSTRMQQMKEELEAMREFMNSRIEIAISETKELKKRESCRVCLLLVNPIEQRTMICAGLLQTRRTKTRSASWKIILPRSP